MDRKQMCIANVKYKKPTADNSKRTKNLLRYLTYRDGRDDYVKQVSGVERWVDRGLGSTVALRLRVPAMISAVTMCWHSHWSSIPIHR